MLAEERDKHLSLETWLGMISSTRACRARTRAKESASSASSRSDQRCKPCSLETRSPTKKKSVSVAMFAQAKAVIIATSVLGSMAAALAMIRREAWPTKRDMLSTSCGQQKEPKPLARLLKDDLRVATMFFLDAGSCILSVLEAYGITPAGSVL